MWISSQQSGLPCQVLIEINLPTISVNGSVPSNDIIMGDLLVEC